MTAPQIPISIKLNMISGLFLLITAPQTPIPIKLNMMIS